MAKSGSLLEDFSELFLGSVNGFVVKFKRSWAEATPESYEHDYDLLIHNTCEVFKEFGNYIGIECKDWKDPVGYHEIAAFIHKLHSRRCSTGIIIALKNVAMKEFNLTIRRAHDQDGITVLVLDEDDITLVLENKINLVTLLRTKYENVRFGFTK